MDIYEERYYDWRHPNMPCEIRPASTYVGYVEGPIGTYQGDDVILDFDTAAIRSRVLTFTVEDVDPETLALVFGIDVRQPICKQEVPARGWN